MNKCTCGASSLGYNTHSDWCDAHNKSTQITIDCLKGPDGGPLVVNDISWAVNKYLDQNIKDLLKNKVTAVISQTHIVKAVGFRASTYKIASAGERLACIINDICLFYKVVGKLSDPIMFDLYRAPGTEPESIYLQYIAFTHKYGLMIEELISTGYGFFIGEGAIPQKIHFR